ncbi:FxSxx-COOH system tetratricopeptide repeat protein [Catenulispora sp. GAS73]|uniref:FxSxx-COOH system tetratricopeptide repeat protein n=1 Tax=Catenulispora sp. GAS73 TaxID=3156269 RepID=UPI0035124669
MAAAAAVRADLDVQVPVPVHRAGVVLPGLGILPVSGVRSAVVAKGRRGWEVRTDRETHLIPFGTDRPAESAGWRTPHLFTFPGRTTGWDWTVSAEFADPFLALPAWRAPALTALPSAFVAAVLGPAWRVLAERHRDNAAEVRTGVSLVVPLRRGVRADLVNATSLDAAGAVWLGLPAPALRLAAALVHEVEHGRLVALHDLVPLYAPETAARHRVPWRDVPRPIGALLHGLFAHAAVAEFWSVETAAGQEGAKQQLERCLRWTTAALRGFTDRHALTPSGAEVVEYVAARLDLVTYGDRGLTGDTVTSYTKASADPRRQPVSQEIIVDDEQVRAEDPKGAEPPTKPTVPLGPAAIVYASMDRMWAEWVREQYERAGTSANLVRYTRDPKTTLGLQIDAALVDFSQVVVLFSPQFMVSVSGEDAEWQDAIDRSYDRKERVVPILVGRCELPGGFWRLEPVNLFGVDNEQMARRRLRARSGLADQVGEGAGFVRYPGREAVLVNHIPARNPQFTGRREHLDRIRTGLTGNRVALLPQALYGLGGIGKTEIALEYTHRFGTDYDLIWWIPADDRATARERLAELGVALGCQDPETDQGERVRFAREALRRGEPYSRWLLVFDNADDIDSVLPELPGSTQTGHVLITSRNPDWAGHGDSVEVDLYPRRESVEFLRRKAPRISVKDANGLADAVQDLPLALEHAASWYSQTGGDAQTYRRLMETEFEPFFEQTEELNRRHNYFNTVASTWLVTRNTLKDDQRTSAIKLLELLAFFAPVPIHMDLIQAVPADVLPASLAAELADDQSRQRMVNAISSRSLAKAHPAEPGRGQVLEMHRLVQLFIATTVKPPEAEKYRAAVRAALAATRPANPLEPRSYAGFVEVIAHLEPSGALTGEDPAMRLLIIDTCRSLLSQGEYRSCLRLIDKALPLWQHRLESSDDEMLTLQRAKALALGNLGDQQARLELDREVYRIAVEARGANDERALRARGGIASALRSLGLVSEAEEVCRDVLERTRVKYGPDDPETLRAMHNYAGHLRLASRPDEALQLDTVVYDKRVARDEAEFSETLGTRTSMAHDLRELGRVFEAVQVQEDNYATCVDVLGAANPETMRATIELAVLRRRTGRYEEAFDIGQTSVERHKARYGTEHPEYICVLTNFAGDCRFVGDLDRGFDAARDAHTKASKLLAAPHPTRAVTATNLAVFLRLKGDLNGATALDAEALAELTEVLGEANHYTLACMINLADDAALAGDLQQARTLHEKAWGWLGRLRGEQHSHTMLAKANLLLDQLALGEVGEEALAELLADSEKAARRGFGLTSSERAAIAERRWLNCDLDLPMY